MKTCPVCQKLVNDEAKFCYYCGANVMNVAPDAPIPAPEPAAEPIPAPVEAPEPVEEPIAGPESIPEPTEEPIEESAPVEEPEPIIVPEQEPEPVEAPEPEPVEAPEPEPVETPEPEEAATPTEPESIVIPEPEPVAEPVVIPPVVVPPVTETPRTEPTPAPAPTVVNATDSRSLMTTAGYIFTTLLFHLPIIGWIFLFVWGCGRPKNISRKRYALAWLIIRLISVIVSLLILVFVLICFSGKFDELYNAVRPILF